MTTDDHATDATPTVSLEIFWEWMTTHPNCVLRAGTPSTLLYDDEDYHWHFAQESNGALLTQVIRGKRLVGELVISPDEVAFVQGTLGDHEGEYIFELVGGDDQQQASVAFFVMAHGFDSQSDDESGGRVH